MSDLKTREGDQPLPTRVKPGRDVSRSLQRHLNRVYGPRYGTTMEVTACERLCRDLEARIQLGVERYGERLQTNNGRDVLRDLYEEILDALHYEHQCEMQRIRLPASTVGDLRRMAMHLAWMMERRDRGNT